MGFYFIQFYIPCIVMVSLSWISFWMDRYYIGERLSLGVTTILTIVFLLGSSNSTMPRVSYAKAIDWYLLGSFIFVFSTLVTDLLVYRFRSKEEERRKEEKEGEKKVTEKIFDLFSQLCPVNCPFESKSLLKRLKALPQTPYAKHFLNNSAFC